MSTIILDFGSGNTSKNDKAYIKKMYDELKAVDTGKHTVIIKWQLFEKAGDNIPLLPECFEYAYQYGTSLGYKVTSSVFDKKSLDFLLEYDVPFIKIANRRDLDWLIGKVPRGISVYVSYGKCKDVPTNWNRDCSIVRMLCVSKYPSDIKDYEKEFGTKEHPFLCGGLPSQMGISDHTTNFGLWYRYQPQIIEWHYVLEHDSNNLDGGPFARTPEMLAEVL